MEIEQKIREKLQKELNPTQLNVINESHLHAGHAGDDGSGQSHFRIEVAAPQFNELSRIDRERLIHRILAEEIRQIHAISIIILP
jgi:BolA protein